MKKTWPTKKLGEVCEIVGGGTPSTNVSEYWNGDIIWVTPKDMGKLTGYDISDSTKKITKAGLKNSSAKLLPKGAVVLSSRAPIGYVAIAEVPLTTNQGCRSFICDESKIYNRYLLHFLLIQKEYLNSLASGLTFKEITGSKLKEIEIPLPPLSEQKKIVEKIEKLFAKIDEAERLRAESLAASAALLPSALHQVFSRAKKENWPTKKLGEVCQIQKGKKPHLYQESDPGCLPYLTAEVLRNGIAKQFASISDRNSVRVSEKEIIIICDGSNSGDVFFGYDGILASTMGKLVHSQEIYTKYLYLFLKQNFEYLNTDKVGAATPHLNQEKFKNLETPLPPLPEQKKIVDYLDDLREKIEKLKQLQQKQLEELNELKNSILEKAFTSELIH